MMGIFAVVGLLVIGAAVAIALGWVNVAGLDPFKNLNAATTRPTTNPVEEDAERATESEASLAALKHPGYIDRVIFLSAADAKVSGRAYVEGTGSSSRYQYSSRRGSGTVDPRNRLPAALIRSWSSPEDVAEWTFDCPAAGKYVVTFDCIPGTYSSTVRGKGIAGGMFTISAGDQKLDAAIDADVRGRHGSSSYHLIDAGGIRLPAGKVTLRIRPTEKQSGLLSLRSVRLYPVTE